MICLQFAQFVQDVTIGGINADDIVLAFPSAVASRIQRALGQGVAAVAHLLGRQAEGVLEGLGEIPVV